MYYVYVLFSKKDHELYIGYTNDLERRIKEHKLGKVRATMFRRPLLLIYYEAYLYWAEAKQREKYLKGGNGRAQLKVQLGPTLKRLGYKHLTTNNHSKISTRKQSNTDPANSTH